MSENNELVIFDNIKQTDEQVGEFWSARDLRQALGYDKWDNFERVIKRAKRSFNVSGLGVSNNINDHFLEGGKMVGLGVGLCVRCLIFIFPATLAILSPKTPTRPKSPLR